MEALQFYFFIFKQGVSECVALWVDGWVSEWVNEWVNKWGSELN